MSAHLCRSLLECVLLRGVDLGSCSSNWRASWVWELESVTWGRHREFQFCDDNGWGGLDTQQGKAHSCCSHLFSATIPEL